MKNSITRDKKRNGSCDRSYQYKLSKSKDRRGVSLKQCPIKSINESTKLRALLKQTAVGVLFVFPPQTDNENHIIVKRNI